MKLPRFDFTSLRDPKGYEIKGVTSPPQQERSFKNIEYEFFRTIMRGAESGRLGKPDAEGRIRGPWISGRIVGKAWPAIPPTAERIGIALRSNGDAGMYARRDNRTLFARFVGAVVQGSRDRRIRNLDDPFVPPRYAVASILSFAIERR